MFFVTTSAWYSPATDFCVFQPRFIVAGFKRISRFALDDCRVILSANFADDMPRKSIKSDQLKIEWRRLQNALRAWKQSCSQVHIS